MIDYWMTKQWLHRHLQRIRNKIKNRYSHEKGYLVAADGFSSHAEGGYSSAQGMYSHSEGSWGTCEGNSSHNEGYMTKAYGDWSHAEGGESNARGEGSHAEGTWTTTMGVSSHAEGTWTKTNNEGEHAEGIFNVSHTDENKEAGKCTIHSVGIGSYTEGGRNAIEIMRNGDIYVKGIGEYDGTSIEGKVTLQDFIRQINNELQELKDAKGKSESK